MAVPALSDAAAAFDGSIHFEWVVDQNLSEVPLWHPCVQKLYLTNHRVWRKTPLSKKTRTEFSTFYKKLKDQEYDFIIDAQANIKSAILSLIPKGRRVGFDASSTKEWGSHFFYQAQCRVSKDLHAVEQLRHLFAQSLNYPHPGTPPNYQINLAKLKKPEVEIPERYLIFVPIASYDSKLWPEHLWKELIAKTVKEGISILLPWGSLKEKERAERLKIHPHVQVLPRLCLSELAYLIKEAQGLVSVDTGLSHMAAALGVPCITLYGPTDPHLTGTVGENQFWVRSARSDDNSMQTISPEVVFENLRQILRY